MTQDELKAELDVQTEKVTKIGTETRTLLNRITVLEEAIANSDKPVSQAVLDALEGLKAQTTVVDELVPDETTPV